MLYEENPPLVSVILPTYNQENFIEESILSAVSQTYKNIEVLISDDASSDKTQEIIERYSKKYPNIIHAIFQEKNQGITKNVNTLLTLCSGKYIVFLGGDDIFCKKKIELQVEMLEKDSQATVCYHDVFVFDDKSKRLLYKVSDRYDQTPECTLEYVLENGPFFSALSSMIRKESLPSYGCDEQITIASDWLMNCECLIKRKGTMIYIPQVLAFYRRHSKSITHDKRNLVSRELEVVHLLEQKYPYYKKHLRLWKGKLYFMGFLRNISFNQKKIAFDYLIMSFKINKSPFFYFKFLLKEIRWRTISYILRYVRKIKF